MEFVKKNLISIICGAIAIVAVATSFVPLGGMVQSVQGELDKSRQTHEQIQSQLNKTRKLPVVDPAKAEGEDLAVFPSPKVLEEGKKIVEEMKKQSMAMRDAAAEMNKHALLVDKSLPMPPGQYQQYKFRDDYRSLLIPAKLGALPNLVNPLKPGIPPTTEELTRRKQELVDKITREQVIVVNGQPTPQSQQGALQAIAAAQEKLPEEMRTAVAEKSLSYVMPDAFDVFQPMIQGAGAPDPYVIFFAQLNLWVQQDVIAAINDSNKGSKNVMDATVKRLVKVQVNPEFVRAPEVPASGDPDAGPIGKSVAISPTGRVSNPLYDVIHFTLVVDVDAARANKFLHDLSRNRLINVCSMNLSQVDLAERMGQGFVYGKEPVVNLQLECEELFLRQWLVAYMPAAVKQSLGIQDQPAAPAEGQPAQPAASAN